MVKLCSRDITIKGKPFLINTLFDFVPPDALRKSLVSIFFKALDATEDYPEDFRKTAQDIHALIQFLDEVAENEGKEF
jgi:hypothetical protein